MGVQTKELSFSFFKILWMLIYSRAVMTTLWHVCQNQHLQNSPQASSSTFCQCCCCSPVSRLRREQQQEDQSGDHCNKWNGLKVLYCPFPESCNTGHTRWHYCNCFGPYRRVFFPPFIIMLYPHYFCQGQYLHLLDCQLIMYLFFLLVSLFSWTFF